MPNYAAIPKFGQLVEYITQGPLVDGVYGIVINTVSLAAFDLSGVDPNSGDTDLRLKNVLIDFIKVLAVKVRDMDLSGIDFGAVIPAAIRIRINIFLTARGWPTIPAGTTWRQLFIAIKARV